MYTTHLRDARQAITHSGGTAIEFHSGVRVNGPGLHSDGVRVNRGGVRVN
ncbi:hypothetical protein GCM10010174_35610 [Kutzneria viridogrisea]|uniref:Uncharacterized protein n=2 Tax=Kutzneria TaxID=43356 RepID=W5W312_9PSEU|nr:hypothetical protein KALB_1524 [Kutzneria albida DSM 43870]MBA8927772.1 hypothetical protein [Kutzneria viridogrisea]